MGFANFWRGTNLNTTQLTASVWVICSSFWKLCCIVSHLSLRSALSSPFVWSHMTTTYNYFNNLQTDLTLHPSSGHKQRPRTTTSATILPIYYLPPALRSPDLLESAFMRALKTDLFSTAQCHWDVFMILAPDINIQTYLLTILRMVSVTDQLPFLTQKPKRRRRERQIWWDAKKTSTTGHCYLQLHTTWSFSPLFCTDESLWWQI